MAQKLPDFGKATKLMREKQRLSQTALRELTGLEASYIARLEHGRFMPSVKTISKLAEAFKISGPEFWACAENHHKC